MSQKKVEQLYATLKKKHTEIYVQRSKLMYKAAPQRTRLFAWNMTNVEILVSHFINNPFKSLYSKFSEFDRSYNLWKGKCDSNYERN